MDTFEAIADAVGYDADFLLFNILVLTLLKLRLRANFLLGCQRCPWSSACKGNVEATNVVDANCCISSRPFFVCYTVTPHA